MHLNIAHTTQYKLDEPAEYGLQQLRLTPSSNKLQTVLGWKLAVQGGEIQNQYKDEHGSQVCLVSVDPKETELQISAEGEIETHGGAGVLGPHTGFAPLWLYKKSTPLTRIGQGIRAIVRSVDSSGEDDIAKLHALSGAIRDKLPYEIGRTDVATSAEDALNLGAGVCQDHAHIFIAAARHMGFPARYVSGYLMMDGQELQDAGHAWAEAHVSGLGWVGFDIPNEICPDERYVRLAVGLDYSEAAPVSGMTWGQGGGSMQVMVQVQQQTL